VLTNADGVAEVELTVRSGPDKVLSMARAKVRV
jgi:hypothetical protein